MKVIGRPLRWSQSNCKLALRVTAHGVSGSKANTVRFRPCRPFGRPRYKEQDMKQASARHILVDSEAKCNELKQQIENGADFADVARANSSCPSKAQGGDLGSFGPGMMVPEFDRVVFNDAVGVVHGPVKTQFGYHLLEITSRND
jgi:peptidyl-prolyl cis-trans isomerase C